MKTTCKILAVVLLSMYYEIALSQQTIENNRICLDPISGRGAYIGSASGGGVCLLCSAGDVGNVIDANQSNYATVSLPVSLVANTPIIIVKDSLQYYPAGNEVGFVVGPNGGLLSAAILTNLKIETYRNGTLVQTGSFGGSPLLNLGVLQATTAGKQILSFVTTADFDEVRLVSTGTVGALTSIRVYNAFEGPANCAHDCTNALTGAELTGTPTTTGASGVCLGGGVGSPGNVTDGDTTINAASITIPIGIGCSRFLQVNAVATYPGNSFAGFLIKDNGTLGLTLLGGITVTTYLNGTFVQSASGNSLLSAVALGGASPAYQVGFKTTLPFNQIRITVDGVASILTDISVYYAYIKLDSDNDGTPDCMDKCSGSDSIDTDGDGVPDACDTNTIDLSLAKSVNNSTPAPGANVVFTITATRDNTTKNATGVKVTDVLPAGLVYVSHAAPTGTNYNQTTGVWNIGSALGGTTNSLALTITATVDTVGIVTNLAQITSTVETDADNTATNDYIATTCVTVPVQMCQGTSLGIIAPTTATTYQWYLNDVAIPGATNDTLFVTQSGNYTVNFTSTTGCAAGNCCPIIINVNALPVISAGTNVAACAGTTVNLVATGTGTFMWNTGATTASISVAPTVTTEYIVSLTSALGCRNSDSVTVTANPAPITANALAICNNNGTTSTSADDTFTITFNPAGGSNTSYTVQLNGVSVGTTYNYGVQSGPIDAGLITGGAKTLRITDSNGCALETSVDPPANCSTCPPKICVPITIVRSE